MKNDRSRLRAVVFWFWIGLRNHFPFLNPPRSAGEIHADFVQLATDNRHRLTSAFGIPN